MVTIIVKIISCHKFLSQHYQTIVEQEMGVSCSFTILCMCKALNII